VLPNTVAKLRDNLRNSGNRVTGKEAYKVIRASLLKLLRKNEPYCSSTNSNCTTDFNEEWAFKDSYICCMATKVTEPHFKNELFLQHDTWEGKTY